MNSGYLNMSYYEKRMLKMEGLKLELEILKTRFAIGHIDRDAYLADLLRIDEEICEITSGTDRL